jgi:LPXTG-motif cell wall-anchored protein
VNTGLNPHSATGSTFDTDVFDPGQARSVTFDQAGNYAYICKPHPWMTGVVQVTAGPAAPAPAPAAPGAPVQAPAAPGTPVQMPRALPRTGDADPPLAGVLALAALLVLGGIVARRREH